MCLKCHKLSLPINCVKAWDVSSHYFSKLIHIKLFILSKLLQNTYNVTENNVIYRAVFKINRSSEYACTCYLQTVNQT